MLSFNLLFLSNLCVNLVVNFNYELFINFVNYSAYHFCIIKICSFVRWHNNWNTIVKSIEELEDESTNDVNAEQSDVVHLYRKSCHSILFGYWIAVWPIITFTVLSYCLNNIIIPEVQGTDLLEYKYMFYSWLPFDQNSRAGRSVATLLQTIYGISSGVHTLTWDSLVMSAMVFYAGQLKALRVRCTHALDNPDFDICKEKLLKCYRHHIALMSCLKLFSELVSPVMFVHLLQVSFTCGVCIIKIIMIRDDMMEKISVAGIFIGQKLQLLLFYWTANEVIVQSGPLAYGVFESKWTTSDVRVRRPILMLSMGMRQRVAFRAGPFSEMSLATFLSVLKSSYSFYTLLNTKN